MSCLGSWPIQHEMARGLGDGVLHQRAREPQPLAVIGGADPRAGLDAGRDRLAEADFLEQLQRRLMDAADIVVGERLEAATGKAGADRADVVGKRLRAQLHPRGPAAGAAGLGFVGHGHGVSPVANWPRRLFSVRGLISTSKSPHSSFRRRPGSACGAAKHCSALKHTDPGLRRDDESMRTNRSTGTASTAADGASCGKRHLAAMRGAADSSSHGWAGVRAAGSDPLRQAVAPAFLNVCGSCLARRGLTLRV